MQYLSTVRCWDLHPECPDSISVPDDASLEGLDEANFIWWNVKGRDGRIDPNLQQTKVLWTWRTVFSTPQLLRALHVVSRQLDRELAKHIRTCRADLVRTEKLQDFQHATSHGISCHLSCDFGTGAEVEQRAVANGEARTIHHEESLCSYLELSTWFDIPLKR